ncbi:MAG: formyltransferase family protein [Xanthobacteraceae bacterium]
MFEHCILITDVNHYLTADALALCRAHFDRVTLVHEKDAKIEDGSVAAMTCDLLVSFLNEHILPPSLLHFTNVNCHPAPPRYPGRGGASYALYDAAATYGATAHVMAERVDTGPILLVNEFPIDSDEYCETLFAKAERSCVDLLARALSAFSKTGKLPPPNGMEWGRRATTRKQFLEWLVLDPSDQTAFERKLTAAYHSRFAGPYIVAHGLKFALVNDENTKATVRTLRRKLDANR